MQFYYGEQNVLRALDEAEFWKHQEAEHTDLIPVVTPGLEPEYLAKLEKLGIEMRDLHSEIVKYIESSVRGGRMLGREIYAQILNLLTVCVDQSNDFVGLLNELLYSSRAVKEAAAAQGVIHHMIRESQYYIGIGQLILT